MALSLGEALQLGSSLLLLALAMLLLVLDRRSAANRAFALLLALRAAAGLSYAGGLAVGDPRLAEDLWRLTPVFALGLVVVPLYFALVFPRPRPWLRRRPWLWAPLFGLGLGLVGLYLAVPTLYWDLATYTGHPGGPALEATVGPLFLADALLVTGYGALAWFFLKDTQRLDGGPHARSTFLVGLAFGLTATYSSVVILSSARSELILRHGTPMAVAILASLLSALVFVALALARSFRTAPVEGAQGRPGARFATWTGVALVSALAPALVAPIDTRSTLMLVQSTAALWRLALPLLVVYALLRYQLFGIELRVKKGVQQGTLVGLIATGFLLLSETLERVVPVGDAIPEVVAAVTIALALHPLQRLAQRFVETLMPAIEDTKAYHDRRRRELYRASLESAALDGVITERERAMLARLRTELGVEEDEARNLEAEVLGRALGARAT